MNYEQLIEKIRTEAKKVQFECPDEIKALYEYHIVKSGQGAKQQAFSTMVFVEGDFRALSYYNIACLARLVDEESFTLDHLKILFAEYIPLSVTFLKTCGFDMLYELMEDCFDVMDSIETKEQMKELLNMYCLYAAIYHQWVHNFFPWYLGELFPQRNDKKYYEEAVRLLEE